MKRIFFDIILFISIFVFPWWVSLFFVFIGIFIFNNFYEFIGAGIIVFALYSFPDDRLISSPVFFSLLLIISYLVLQFIKSNIILYKK